MKRVIVGLLVLVFIFGGIASAQDRYRSFRGFEAPELTAEQQGRLTEIWSQMAELRGELIETLQEFGAISEERLEWMSGRRVRTDNGREWEGSRRGGFGHRGCFGAWDDELSSRRHFRR